jgi:poly-gamma-glutamate capsule biosynthesis protein CapA/YwtB (metallophosphatase superfamily)
MPTLALVGDVMLGRGVNAVIPRRPPEWFWGDVLPVLRAADAVFANLECAITTHRRPWGKTPKVFYFRADPAALEVLRAGNIRYVSLANNHVLDYDIPGLLDTLRYLDEAGISHAGAGRNREEAEAPALVEVGGVRVGVVSATDNEPPFAAGPEEPGTNYLEIRADPETLGRVEGWVARARQNGAQLVVLSLHWGPNMVLVPPAPFRTFARAVTSRGVDLLHGHSAHLFQGVERIGNRLVLYDTGDFLDDYAVDPELRNDWSFVFLVDLDPDARPRRLRLMPVRLRYARVQLARGEDFEAICERMRTLSAAFGTHLQQTPEGLVLSLE